MNTTNHPFGRDVRLVCLTGVPQITPLAAIPDYPALAAERDQKLESTPKGRELKAGLDKLCRNQGIKTGDFHCYHTLLNACQHTIGPAPKPTAGDLAITISSMLGLPTGTSPTAALAALEEAMEEAGALATDVPATLSAGSFTATVGNNQELWLVLCTIRTYLNLPGAASGREVLSGIESALSDTAGSTARITIRAQLTTVLKLARETSDAELVKAARAAVAAAGILDKSLVASPATLSADATPGERSAHLGRIVTDRQRMRGGSWQQNWDALQRESPEIFRAAAATSPDRLSASGAALVASRDQAAKVAAIHRAINAAREKMSLGFEQAYSFVLAAEPNLFE